MGRMFVLFVNDHGFISDGDGIVNNVTEAYYFDSRKEAEKHRDKLYRERADFQNTISILEWL